MSTLKYWVWLSSLIGVNAETANKLLLRFGTPEQVYFARAEDLREVPDIKQREVKAVENKDLARANKILSDCETLGCRVLTIQDAEYPERLRNIYDPPTVLYIRGRLPVIDEEPAFAIVGTRDCTPYGLRNAEAIGYGLARNGFVIVTGLARGVDTAAAKGALRGGGRVVGLLGGGVDVIYPPENRGMYEDVASSGALVSEYPPGTETMPGHFPVRNRIISGMSLGVGVIEAPVRSGALITAARALEQGRDVFALPGNVDSTASAGANRLLREGAIPLIDADDVAREYADLFPSKITWDKPKFPLDPRQERRLVESGGSAKRGSRGKSELSGAENVDKSEADVYAEREAAVAAVAESLEDNEKAVYLAIAELTGGDGAYADEVIQRSGLPAHDVLGIITMLEIDGLIASLGSGFYRIT